jgi:two-component system response regulator AtoC
MSKVNKLLQLSALRRLPVLITGEVGAGKELVAREIHRIGARSQQPLVKLHCAVLGDDFLDNIHAHAAELAAGGTLLLDDIAELSLVLQDKLLELLRQDDDPASVGTRHGVPGLRVIAVTHHDLPEAVEVGTFSEDLYYRFNLMHIHVPPLREHREDIAILFDHFFAVHSARDAWAAQVPSELRERFCAYPWPGNIRELESAVRRSVMLRDPEYVIDELEAELAGKTPSASVAPPAVANAQGDPTGDVDLKEIGRHAAELAERAAIVDMLARTLGNKKESARRLGISYKALLYKMRDFGISTTR